MTVHSSHNLIFFFFNDTATTEIYTLSLHDALPIFTVHPTAGGRTTWPCSMPGTRRLWTYSNSPVAIAGSSARGTGVPSTVDRKSTRLNSSHLVISYAVFCLKKKKNRSALRTHRTLD